MAGSSNFWPVFVIVTRWLQGLRLQTPVGNFMSKTDLEKPLAELGSCPICRDSKELGKTVCWTISPPMFALFLVDWKQFYLVLPCCGSCHYKVGLRRYLQMALMVLLPIGVIQGLIVAEYWFPEYSNVRMFLMLIGGAAAVWFATFSATRLDRVRVFDERLIEQAKQLSRKRLRNADPRFMLSHSPGGAERVEFGDEASPSN